MMYLFVETSIFLRCNKYNDKFIFIKVTDNKINDNMYTFIHNVVNCIDIKT